MDRYRDKYSGKSPRNPYWDYKSPGWYFITVVTQGRIWYFGKPGKLSKIGIIVKDEWLRAFELRKDMNLTCGEFVVMPNHFHALIRIGKNEYNQPVYKEELNVRKAQNLSSANKHENLIPKKKVLNRFGPQSKNLGAIVKGFKSAVTMKARQLDPEFGWQKRYHDRIIRNEEEMKKIRNYIKWNPKNWKDGDGIYPI